MPAKQNSLHLYEPIGTHYGDYYNMETASTSHVRTSYIDQ
jgi:hypothetical protein